MDPTRDNPLFRFKAAFWGLGLFALFAVALWVAWMFSGDAGPTLEEVAAAARYQKAAEVKAAQEEQLAWKEIEAGKLIQAPPGEVFGHLGEQLLAAKPAAVERPDQVVPGTPTAKRLEEEAAAAAAKVEIPAVAADAPIDPAVMAVGKTQFMICMACHGPEGKGTANLTPPLAPPLAGSNWVMGPVENLIRIQLRGLQGPITVSGTEYTFAAPMTPQSFQTDEQIAAVLTYVRNSWGNKASQVTPEQVRLFRGEVGLPMLTVADLKPPAAKPEPAAPPEKPAAPVRAPNRPPPTSPPEKPPRRPPGEADQPRDFFLMSDLSHHRNEPDAVLRAAIDRSLRHPVMFFFTSGAAWLAVSLLLGLISSAKMHARVS